MTRKEVVAAALDGSRPPYVPWQLDFTQEAEEKLQRHFNTADLTGVLQNHFLPLGNQIVKFERLGNGRVKDYFGTVWDRSVDKDIGVVEEPLLASPTLQGYEFPDPYGDGSFETIEARISGHSDLYALYYMGFSLYERAWILRGMENLLMDFYQNPEFARELLETITEYNLQVIRNALTYPIDGIYFGDDWGQQNGLIMGPKLWREFIYPQLKRMYSEVKKEGKKVFIHSCGDVDELFDDLIEIGLDCFNPFQPEVMDVDFLIKQYSGRLAFHGGLSTQRTLPYGTTRDVAAETAKLLKLGSRGGYIFAPAHAVEGDVPLENMLTFIDLLKEQTGFCTGP